MKISASVYSNTHKPLEDLVRELDRYGVDFFHIDCNDNLNVFDDIEKIRAISSTPVDLHIISSEPEKFFNGIINTKTEIVSFQVESLKEIIPVPDEVNSKLGLAIVSDTPVEAFIPYKDNFDFMLFMATSPGKSGGRFNVSNFQRIRKFKTLFPSAKAHVDGGVNDEVSFVLRNMGVSLVVSGSYLVNADYIGAALHNLRRDTGSSHIFVKDFMIDRNESPVLIRQRRITFQDVLRSIEDFNMGFTMIESADGALEGIITNADVRRGLLKNINNLHDMDVSSMINSNPVKVNQNSTVSEMLSMVKTLKFPVLFLPVVDDWNRLVGTVTFNNLIKGES